MTNEQVTCNDCTPISPETIDGRPAKVDLCARHTGVQLLEEIYEHFDGIADGAPDASYPAKMALQFSEPLKQLIERLKEDPS